MSDMGRTTSSTRAGGSPAADKTKTAARAPKRDADGLAKEDGLGKEASAQLDDIKDKVRDVADRTRGQAAELVDAVKDRARQALDEQKSAGADRVAGVADAIHNAADELDEQLPFAADYVRDAAEGVERLSSSLRERSIEDLARTVANFARQQPVAFFGAAVFAGFVATRFLKASTETSASSRRRRGRQDAISEYPWESEPPASARGQTYASGAAETLGGASVARSGAR